MNDYEENIYIEGRTALARDVIRAMMGELGDNDPIRDRASWVLERSEAISYLRGICREYGDNNWNDDLHIVDILDKHLYRHLCEPTRNK